MASAPRASSPDETQGLHKGKCIVLRGYMHADLHSMFHLDVLCFEEPFRFSKAAMRRFAEARKAQVVLAFSGAELAGFTIVHTIREDGETAAYLLTLDVAPAVRRQGVAGKLMHQAETDARAAGCRTMLLHVFIDNTAALSLYEQLGYSRGRLVEDFYSNGLHAWVYRKELLAP